MFDCVCFFEKLLIFGPLEQEILLGLAQILSGTLKKLQLKENLQASKNTAELIINVRNASER